MNITLVTDQFFQNGHGTSVSAQRLYDSLVEKGHKVKVVAIDSGENTDYAVKERNFGKTINKIVHSQGFQPAKPDRQVLQKAIKGSDIVHVYLPFKLGYKTIEICREMNVPCTAAFHILPENITSTLYLENFFALNSSLWSKFYNTTYRYVKHIHCPSLMVAKQLQKHKFNSYLHVISNGFSEEVFHLAPKEKPEIFQGKFVITFTGRFSREKRYDLIIKAVNESKFRDKIQLIFGGKGPCKSQIMKMAKCLPIYPIFLGPYNRAQQISFLSYADLYIHPADIEVEGMTCVEAIACGCVPIVSDSEKSATPQFTLTEHSLFKNGDHKDLAEKIDWWLSHPQTLAKHKKEIAEHAKKFNAEKSIELYLKMFEAAIKDWDCKYDGKSKNAIKPTIINEYSNKN